jgi:hypothetical protein
MWVVYERPSDYPDGFIARLWAVTLTGTMPLPFKDAVLTGATLEEIREKLTPYGLCRLERDPRDEPQIVEVWV